MIIPHKVSVEVCAFALESCLNAQQAGASRIELCGGLYEGGTSPSSGLISLVKKSVDLDLFVMIRPRGGDFLYSESEINTMIEEIELTKKLGADGIVLGILKKNGEVNLELTKQLVEQAFPMKVTFHRAIDVTPNAIEALEMIIESGCERILSSGQQNKAIDGLNTISQMVEKSAGRIEIMAGSGVNAENAHFFLEKGVNALHLTGKSIRQSGMEYRKKTVQMGEFDGISEFEIVYSDYEKIKAIVEIANKF
ncbi:MAG: copper homeostasis protein CutC [Bacteroidota bacterium]